ncbi:cyclic nucleotide-binding domain-containing protein [Roseibacterium sp. SDUM158017]|uniref:Crp/Fnr family transcriptional regulator n=1 Tax=Roseicyclus salinarum TaxID=3036773 RepID=UPI0024156675|nr:cyclic nucleotide-binding domain-containing protein [Roseibacterium sp. SDUM158017]MDG4648182.1 cyclic nucleotide-binding domain-containing protein [Roseibacterium sp. SDUM158017]
MDMLPDPIELVGYLASVLVFITFCMKTLVWLRVAAVVSNIAFIVYGVGGQLFPILLLHSALLPMNLFRLGEQVALIRRVRKATQGPSSAEVLLPFMTEMHVADGAVVFRRGDEADTLYYVQEGRVEIVEFGKFLDAGEIFGEIGLFSDGKLRTATVRAAGRATLCAIDRPTVLRIYQEHPEFGLMLTRLITDRMVENQAQLYEQLASSEARKTRA